jgi:hypothetical protein
MALRVPSAEVRFGIRPQYPRSGSVACIPPDRLRIPRSAADHQARARDMSLEHVRLVDFPLG